MRNIRLALLFSPLLLSAALARPAEVQAVSPASRHALAPELAIAPNGDVAVIWLDREPQASVSAAPAPAPAAHEAMQHDAADAGDRHLSSMDLWFARSSDGGATFAAPVRVNPDAGMVWGFSVSKPKIAISRAGIIHVIFPANNVQASSGKTTLVMYYTRSTDGGRSFEAPRHLHQLLAIDQSAFMDGGFTSAHAFGALGVAPDSSVHAIWVDTRTMRSGDTAAAAYSAVSTDDGRTFSTERAALSDGVCPCCQLTVAFDANSNMYLGSRFVTGDGHRNSTVARVGGGPTAKFGARVPIGSAAWKLAGCPLKPTVVAVDGAHVYATAYNGGEASPGVYFSASQDSGAHFGKARAVHPAAAVSDAPAMVIANGLPVIAWHGKTTAGKRVFWRTVSRGGALMGPVQELAAPEGPAQSAALATRRDGGVQIVWQQGEQIYTTALDPVAPTRVAAAR